MIKIVRKECIIYVHVYGLEKGYLERFERILNENNFPAVATAVILDPATPRTRKHQLAERQMTTGPAAQVLKRHMDAVVKVYCVHSKPNFELPWQVRQQTTSKSTGFAVLDADGERCILTNAHSVTYSSQVQLKKRGDDERYPAKVLAVGTECDVALLAVEDEEFWKGIMPLALSNDLPELQESVAVAGFPIGGDSLAISAGVVSRVQMTHCELRRAAVFYFLSKFENSAGWWFLKNVSFPPFYHRFSWLHDPPCRAN